MKQLHKNVHKLILVSVLLLSPGCEDNKDALPESATLSGDVTFSGVWPSTGTVYLSVHNNWYPTGAPYMYETVTSSQVSSDNKYSFALTDVAFGTYGALTISWQHPTEIDSTTGQPSQTTIGVYGGTVATGFADADSLMVSQENAEITGLDFDANFNYLSSN